MDRINYLDISSLVLIIVGAVNWGLVGLGNVAGASGSWNLVSMLLGETVFANAVYLLIGLSGLYQVYFGYQLYETELDL